MGAEYRAPAPDTLDVRELDVNHRIAKHNREVKEHIFEICLHFGVDKETITVEDYLFLFSKFAKKKRDGR